MPENKLSEELEKIGSLDNVDIKNSKRVITQSNRYANVYNEDYLDMFKLNFMMKQPHHDSTKFGWLLSLTDKDDCVGGTAFLKHKETDTINYLACKQELEREYGSEKNLMYIDNNPDYDTVESEAIYHRICESRQWIDGTKYNSLILYPYYDGLSYYTPYWYPNEWKTRAGDVKDNGTWEVYHFLPQVYNRFYFFVGQNYHSAVIPQDYYKGERERFMELGFMDTDWQLKLKK